MLASQKGLLDQLITRVEAFRTQASQVNVEVVQVVLKLPEQQEVVFEWAPDLEPPEFKVRTG